MTCTTLLVAISLMGTPNAPTAPNDALLDELVRKLGDRSFRVREIAARDILRSGSAAVGPLLRGMADSDPEISERCKQLLPVVATIEREEKLALLLKKPAQTPPKGLAGLERFLKIVGDEPEAREIYAELMTTHFAIMEAATKDPKAGARELKKFCDEAYNRWQSAARAGNYSYDTIITSRADATLFFFLSGDPAVGKQNDAFNSRSTMILNAPRINRLLTGKEASPVMKKLFIDWLTNESQPYMQQRGFQIAAQAGMKEVLPVALKMIEKKELAPYHRAMAMIALVKLGDKTHVKNLEPYLDNNTQVGTVNFGNGGQQTIQVRDVAMGVSVQLAGQKPGDFGFDVNRGGGVMAMSSSYIYYGFPDDKPRDEAHKKWKDWAEKNLKPKK